MDEEQAAAEEPLEDTGGDGQSDDNQAGGQPVPSDMGVVGGSQPSGKVQPAQAIVPQVTLATPITPDTEIPAAPLLVPATPGFGNWGTEQ